MGRKSSSRRQWIIQAARETKYLPTTKGGLDIQDNLTNKINWWISWSRAFLFQIFSNCNKDVIDLSGFFKKLVYTPTLFCCLWRNNGRRINFLCNWKNPHDESQKLLILWPHWKLGIPNRRRMMAGYGRWVCAVEPSGFAKDLGWGCGRAGIGSELGPLQGLGYHWSFGRCSLAATWKHMMR